jgi:hypothetical protein
MTKMCKKAAQDFHRAVSKVFDRVKSVALWSANIRKLAKDHKGYGSAARVFPTFTKAGSDVIMVVDIGLSFRGCSVCQRRNKMKIKKSIQSDQFII